MTVGNLKGKISPTMAARTGKRPVSSGKPAHDRGALRKPDSATNFGINLVALAVGLLVLYLLLQLRPGTLDTSIVLILTCASIAVIVIGGERLWRGPALFVAAGLSARLLRPFSLKHAATRVLGLGVTLGLIALTYWLFPEYHGDFYEPFWRFLRLLAPGVVPAALVYFLWSDARLNEPDDVYWHLGRIALGRGVASGAPALLREHFLGWTVKAFFLPLMVVYLTDQIAGTPGLLADVAHNGFGSTWYQLLLRSAYTVDLLFCVVGYTMTLRLFDSHIRSTEPTMLGWVVALICYQPFYSVIGNWYLRYDESGEWLEIFSGYPTLSGFWGAFIIVLVILYGLATVAFGIRFSNLTHRGIVTTGPYRFTRHPAYVCKNLSWWLISVPFLTGADFGTGLRHCCLLGLLNTVYFLRAKTEERHLSRDPVYVAYSEWMDQHGIFSRMRQSIGAMRRPAGKRS
ncbi:MAG: isoprenylcysteine carboxylmethyltransferase family protein [Gammaproteobacteria bacterium]